MASRAGATQSCEARSGGATDVSHAKEEHHMIVAARVRPFKDSDVASVVSVKSPDVRSSSFSFCLPPPRVDVSS